MKLGLRKDVDWEYVGALLARGDSGEQVSFFRAFVQECNTWGTAYQVEQQLASINIELSPAERETLAMLGYDER